MNPLLSTLRPIWEHPSVVFVDSRAIEEAASRIAGEEFPVPSWREPVFPPEDNETFVNFIGVGNSINFAFTDFDTLENFTVEYNGLWRGAFAMWACLKRALDRGTDITDATVLSRLTFKRATEIFAGRARIPMLQERWEILREVGHTLRANYRGSFWNVLSESGFSAFGDAGVVELLCRDFPSFRDWSMHMPTGTTLQFAKRAQLFGMMYSGRALSSRGLPVLNDFPDLGPIADYSVPIALRALNILKYSPEVEADVQFQRKLGRDSLAEQEIRAQTINAQIQLLDRLNYIRSSRITFLNLDYKLWMLGRSTNDPHHLTYTTAY